MHSKENSVINLKDFTPAILNFISNKLASGASQHYLKVYGVGIEIWRCLVLLAIDEKISAQYISNTIGLDKAAVSRCFKYLHKEELITFSSSDKDGRLRLATITPKGLDLHNKIIELAKVRQEAFLSPLTKKERETLNKLLWRLHDNLPNVELTTNKYIEDNDLLNTL